MAKEILNLEEAAELLQVAPRCLRREATRGHVPARRVGREWRFSRPGLHAWLSYVPEEKPKEDPWIPLAGSLADSDVWDEVMANIQANRDRERREADEEAEAEKLAA